MKHTEEQIKKIAIKVLNDLEWPFDESKGVRPIERTIADQIEEVKSQKKHPRFNDYVATLFPFWDVIFDFPEDDKPN